MCCMWILIVIKFVVYYYILYDIMCIILNAFFSFYFMYIVYIQSLDYANTILLSHRLKIIFYNFGLHFSLYGQIILTNL